MCWQLILQVELYKHLRIFENTLEVWEAHTYGLCFSKLFCHVLKTSCVLLWLNNALTIRAKKKFAKWHIWNTGFMYQPNSFILLLSRMRWYAILSWSCGSPFLIAHLTSVSWQFSFWKKKIALKLMQAVPQNQMKKNLNRCHQWSVIYFFNVVKCNLT